MSKAESFGPILYKSDAFIVRGKEENGIMQVVIHKVYQGIELMPFSYGQSLQPSMITAGKQ